MTDPDIFFMAMQFTKMHIVKFSDFFSIYQVFVNFCNKVSF